mmetsp:Transcript_1017/g.2133  ORF Transcript_1017/g.2133 Transcript_1017/m.2133 type:complete len:190 (+) Transcript_1017:194-763(+)
MQARRTTLQLSNSQSTTNLAAQELMLLLIMEVEVLLCGLIMILLHCLSKSAWINLRYPICQISNMYVVESTPFYASPSPRPAPSPNVPTINSNKKQHKAKRTSFTGASGVGGLLCNGKRAHARGKNGNVTYTLVPNKVCDTNKDGIIAEVWGGWSEYHGAVTLTPRIIFKKKDSASLEIGQDQHGQGEL